MHATRRGSSSSAGRWDSGSPSSARLDRSVAAELVIAARETVNNFITELGSTDEAQRRGVGDDVQGEHVAATFVAPGYMDGPVLDDARK